MTDTSLDAVMRNAAPERRRAWGIGETPPHIKKCYRRLVLVSHPSHFAEVDLNDDDTLIVTHGWLMWQVALAEGRHCVQYESEACRQVEPSAPTDLFIRAQDWVYVNGEDVTKFCGVSLGELFSREIAILMLERLRLVRSIDTLIARYGPSEIVYFDARAEHCVLDAEGRFRVVAERAEHHEVTIIDRRDPPAGDDRSLPFHEYYGKSGPPFPLDGSRATQALRIVFERLMGIGAWLDRRLSPRRWSVFLASTHLTSLPLIENFDAKGVLVQVLAAWFPNKRSLRFILRSAAKGIFPISAPRTRLDAGELETIAKIEARITMAANDCHGSEAASILRHVRDHIVATGRLRGVAAEVTWARALLLLHRPDAMFSDGLDYLLCHVFFILAKSLGITTIATWHGHYIQDVKMGILGCDPKIGSAVDWFFTWGRANEDWLKAIGAKSKVIRTGSPTVLRGRTGSAVANRKERVLVLQCVANGEDHIFLQASQYPFFVDVIRMLRDVGTREIRFKVHPGPYSRPYYEDVATFFDLDVDIYKDEPFQEFVAWADLVIGPAVSGALVEVLGAGKPYYPVLLAPNAVNSGYLDGHPVFSGVEDLRAALVAERAPDFEGLLDDFAGTGEFSNPARRTWDVLGSVLGGTAEELALRR